MGLERRSKPADHVYAAPCAGPRCGDASGAERSPLSSWRHPSQTAQGRISMTVSMYKISVPIFVQFLTSLSAVLDKAAAYAEAKKVDPSVLLNTRLAPDMFPLLRQVRAATDHAISAGGRFAGVDFADVLQQRGDHPGAEGSHRQDHRIPQEPQARRCRRHRGQGDQDHLPQSAPAASSRPVSSPQQFAAEFLFPLHHGLRHRSPLRHRASANAISWGRRSNSKANRS